MELAAGEGLGGGSGMMMGGEVESLEVRVGLRLRFFGLRTGTSNCSA